MLYTLLIVAILTVWVVLRILGAERLRQWRIMQIQLRTEEAAAKEAARKLAQASDEELVDLKAA